MSDGLLTESAREPRIAQVAFAAILAVATALLVSPPLPVSAQEPGTMVITFDDPAEVFDEVAREHLGDWLIAVFADGQLCVVADAGIEGSFEVVLGESDQPVACRTLGAVVRFVSGHGHLLFVETTVAPDTTFNFVNWAPLPPHTEYPEYVCAFLDERSVDSAACFMTGPPPSGAGHGVGTLASDPTIPGWVLAAAIVLAGLLAVRVATGRTR